MRQGFHSRVLSSLALFVLVAGSIAAGQIEPINGMPMTLGGETGVGVAGSSASSGPGSTSVIWSTSATLDGYYHDPRFLRFNVSPLYTYTRDAEALDLFHGDNEGLNANVEFLDASKMPVSFSYGLVWNGTTALATGPSPISSESSGFSHNWALGWSYHNGLRWPTLTVSYGAGGSESMLANGEGGQVDFLHRNLLLTATYNIVGFRFFANYNLFHVEEQSPDLLALGLGGNTKSNQKSYVAGGDRALPWIRGNTDFRASRTETEGSLFGSGMTQSFDLASATVNSAPTKHLVLNSTAAYNSNGLAQALSGFLVNNQTGTATPYSTTIFTPLGSSRSISGSGSYALGHGFNAYGVVGEEKDDISSVEEATALTTAGGLGYSHRFFGGNLSLAYSIGRTDVQATLNETNAEGKPILVPVGNSVLTNSAVANYFRPVGRWTMAGSFRFIDTGLSQLGIPITGVSKGIGAVFSASTRLWNAWNFAAGGNYNRSDVAPALANASVSEGLNASFGNRTLSVSGQFQRASGYSSFSAFGVAPITEPGAVPIISEYTAVYGSVSNGDTVAVTWTHRKLVLDGNYTHSALNLSQTGLKSSESSNNFGYIQARYHYRKLIFRAEFRHWTQFVSTNKNLSLSTNSYIFEVLRPFQLF